MFEEPRFLDISSKRVLKGVSLLVACISLRHTPCALASPVPDLFFVLQYQRFLLVLY